MGRLTLAKNEGTLISRIFYFVSNNCGGNSMTLFKHVGLCAGLALGAAMSVITIPAFADTIEGDWKTESGEIAGIAKCGGSYCIKLKTGKYSGKSIGRMNGADGNYKGSITDPEDDKKYSGTIKISGSSMKMKGCVVWPLCKTQTWHRE
jgi:uncharacterized protein (DUF2147 family)